MHLMVRGGTHFCLWRVLEHLVSTNIKHETQLDPTFLLYWLMKQPEMSRQGSMCGI